MSFVFPNIQDPRILLKKTQLKLPGHPPSQFDHPLEPPWYNPIFITVGNQSFRLSPISFAVLEKESSNGSQEQ